MAVCRRFGFGLFPGFELFRATWRFNAITGPVWQDSVSQKGRQSGAYRKMYGECSNGFNPNPLWMGVGWAVSCPTFVGQQSPTTGCFEDMLFRRETVVMIPCSHLVHEERVLGDLVR